MHIQISSYFQTIWSPKCLLCVIYALLSACSKRVSHLAICWTIFLPEGFFCTICIPPCLLSRDGFLNITVSPDNFAFDDTGYSALSLSYCAEYFFAFKNHFHLLAQYNSCITDCNVLVQQLQRIKVKVLSHFGLLMCIKCKRVFKMIPIWLLAAASLSALRLIGMHNA